MRTELTDGGGRRRDYGPKGFAGIVLAPVLPLAAALVALLAGCGPNTEPGGRVGSGIDWTPSTTPAVAPTQGGGR